MTPKSVTIFYVCVGITVLITAYPDAASALRSLDGSYERYEDSPEAVSEPRKRPFCNAFAGCGRKRSYPVKQLAYPEPTPLRKNAVNDILDDSMETLIGMSSEPVVEDLSRQIMSEAKLWEAIQEASAELARRRKQGNS